MKSRRTTCIATRRVTFSTPITLLSFSSFCPTKPSRKGEDNCTGRVTVTANTTGMKKLPPFVIGKSLPLCFRKICSLPTDYAANSEASMASELFKQWLRKLDREFKLRDRRVPLIVDDC